MKKTILFFIMLLCIQFVSGHTRFKHILITNDDGIEDSDRLSALALSVKDVADRVSIIVSAFDRSGTSNHTLYGKYKSSFEVTCEYADKDKNVAVYTIPDNPADCVLLGLSGFFGDDRPDLVLSGINSGPNIGAGWFGSGTIGAARTAAFLGVKAIAFSGFNKKNKKSFSMIPKWIKKFISSGITNGIRKNSYLTIGFPRIPFEKIKGIKLAERRVSYDYPEAFKMKKIYGNQPHLRDNETVWIMEITKNPNDKNLKYDDFYLQKGFIVITPMTINENDTNLLEKLKSKSDLIPNFNQ